MPVVAIFSIILKILIGVISLLVAKKTDCQFRKFESRKVCQHSCSFVVPFFLHAQSKCHFEVVVVNLVAGKAGPQDYSQGGKYLLRKYLWRLKFQNRHHNFDGVCAPA